MNRCNTMVAFEVFIEWINSSCQKKELFSSTTNFFRSEFFVRHFFSGRENLFFFSEIGNIDVYSPCKRMHEDDGTHTHTLCLVFCCVLFVLFVLNELNRMMWSQLNVLLPISNILHIQSISSLLRPDDHWWRSVLSVPSRSRIVLLIRWIPSDDSG